MTRTVVVLIVAVVLVFGVLSFTSQSGSEAKQHMIALIEDNGFSPDQSDYLVGLVERFDAPVAKDSRNPDDGEVNTAAYVQLMLSRFTATARDDGKPGEFIEKLANLRASGAVGSG